MSPGEAERGGRLGRRMAWLVGWGAKGGLAVTDQALFAGAQFVLNILLARWLAPAEYGAFAVAYSVFLLASGVHNAFVLEPMIVFGSGKHFGNRRSYLGIVLRGHWLLTVPIGLVLFGAAFLLRGLYSQPVEHALYALSLVLPLLLLAWLTRRAFYIELRPGRAAAGSAVYFCSLLALVLALHATGKLTPAGAVVAMGLAALLTAGLQLAWLHPQWKHAAQESSPRSIAREHWTYGRWVLATVLPSWTLLNLYYLVLPAWFGLGAAGALKALMNLAMPARHSLIAVGALVTPLLIQHRGRGGVSVMRRTVRRVAVLFLGGAAVYFVVLWLFRVQLIRLLYGGKYLEYSGLPVLLVGLVPLATACVVIFGSALRAYVRPDRIFWGNLAGSFLTVSVGLWLVASWGLAGAISGYLISLAAQVAMLWFFYQRLGPTSAAA